MYNPSPVGFSFTRGKNVCTDKQKRVRTREQERNKKSDEGSAYRSFRAFPRISFTLLQKPDSPVPGERLVGRAKGENGVGNNRGRKREKFSPRRRVVERGW